MKADDAQKMVESGLERLMSDPAEWTAWAKTLAKFPKYSPGNALLIMVQCPDASYVAGYRAWQGLGRQVEKGQKAIVILAPVTKKVAEKDQDTKHKEGVDSADDKDRKLVGFRTASVFDVSQTDGEPLKLPEVEPLVGDRMAAALQRLIPVVGVPVAFGNTGEAYGVWKPAEGTITIRATAPPDHQFKTLLHEWSHSLGVATVADAASMHRGVEEVVAETTAFVVAGSLGLDTTTYSKGYVAGWAQADPKVVAQATHEIGKRVHAIIQSIEKAAEKDPELKALTASWQPIAPPIPAPPEQVQAAGHSR